MPQILFIANRTCECPTVVEAVTNRARTSDAEVLLVAPALNSRLRHLVSDTDQAVADARLRVKDFVDRLRAAGVRARGEVGDADPFLAIEDALVGFSADELVIATHPPEHSHWLEKRLLERTRDRTGLRVTHLVSRYGLVDA